MSLLYLTFSSKRFAVSILGCYFNMLIWSSNICYGLGARLAEIMLIKPHTLILKQIPLTRSCTKKTHLNWFSCGHGNRILFLVLSVGISNVIWWIYIKPERHQRLYNYDTLTSTLCENMKSGVCLLKNHYILRSNGISSGLFLMWMLSHRRNSIIFTNDKI